MKRNVLLLVVMILLVSTVSYGYELNVVQVGDYTGTSQLDKLENIINEELDSQLLPDESIKTVVYSPQIGFAGLKLRVNNLSITREWLDSYITSVVLDVIPAVYQCETLEEFTITFELPVINYKTFEDDWAVGVVVTVDKELYSEVGWDSVNRNILKYIIEDAGGDSKYKEEGWLASL